MEHLLKFSYSHKTGEVYVEYETPIDGKMDEKSLKTKSEPAKELKESLQALAREVCGLCEFPPGWVDEITVRGVTLKPDGNDAPGVTITALRRLQDCATPLVINTPFQKLDSIQLQDLSEKALLFVKGGMRAQRELEFATAVGG